MNKFFDCFIALVFALFIAVFIITIIRFSFLMKFSSFATSNGMVCSSVFLVKHLVVIFLVAVAVFDAIYEPLTYQKCIMMKR